MKPYSPILDSIRINDKQLVLISENRISFISNVSSSEIAEVYAEEHC